MSWDDERRAEEWRRQQQRADEERREAERLERNARENAEADARSRAQDREFRMKLLQDQAPGSPARGPSPRHGASSGSDASGNLGSLAAPLLAKGDFWGLEGLVSREQEPERADVLCYGAQASLGRCNFTEALGRAERALQKNSTDTETRLVRIEALIRLRRLAEAEQGLLALPSDIRTGPWDPDADRLQGMLALERGDLSMADIWAECALKKRPYQHRFQMLMGDVARRRGRHARAIECYDAAMRGYSSTSSAWSGKAESLLAMRRYDEAEHAADIALIGHPRPASARELRARVRASRQNYTEALEDIREGLAVEETPELYELRAWVLWRSEDNANAQSAANAAFRLFRARDTTEGAAFNKRWGAGECPFGSRGGFFDSLR